jgi:hypothetical protein
MEHLQEQGPLDARVMVETSAYPKEGRNGSKGPKLDDDNHDGLLLLLLELCNVHKPAAIVIFVREQFEM